MDARGVDVNTAGLEELKKVGGLGEERARRIIDERPFNDWEDLKRIPGFSDKLIEDLREAGATVGGGARRAGGVTPAPGRRYAR